MEQASKIVRISEGLEGSKDVKERNGKEMGKKWEEKDFTKKDLPLSEVRTMVTYSGLDSATHVTEAQGLDR